MLIDLCYSFNACISLHILHTVLYAFPKVLTRRLYLTINRSLNIWFGGGGVLDVGHSKGLNGHCNGLRKKYFWHWPIHTVRSVEVSILIPLFSKPGWKSSWMIKYFCTVIVSMENRIDIFRDSYRLKINLVMSPE